MKNGVLLFKKDVGIDGRSITTKATVIVELGGKRWPKEGYRIVPKKLVDGVGHPISYIISRLIHITAGWLKEQPSYKINEELPKIFKRVVGRALKQFKKFETYENFKKYVSE